MHICLESLNIGENYSRDELAGLWGYKSAEAIKRGVVTPSGTNIIILFITREKDKYSAPYEDFLVDDILHMDGENGHQSDLRLSNSLEKNDKVILFYRDKSRTKFTYYGEVKLIKYKTNNEGKPSRFVFGIL